MRALIIEDDPGVAALLCRYLRPLVSEEPIIAKTMEEAVKVIDGNVLFDLITVDINLPDSFGDLTLSKVKDFRDRNPNALVVIVTGTLTMESEGLAIASGADGLMTKPYNLSSRETFLSKLSDVARSILRTPEKYRKNLSALEEIVTKISDQKASGY